MQTVGFYIFLLIISIIVVFMGAWNISNAIFNFKEGKYLKFGLYAFGIILWVFTFIELLLKF